MPPQPLLHEQHYVFALCITASVTSSVCPVFHPVPNIAISVCKNTERILMKFATGNHYNDQIKRLPRQQYIYGPMLSHSSFTRKQQKVLFPSATAIVSWSSAVSNAQWSVLSTACNSHIGLTTSVGWCKSRKSKTLVESHYFFIPYLYLTPALSGTPSEFLYISCTENYQYWWSYQKVEKLGGYV